MKLTLNKKKLKGLTADDKSLPNNMTPKVAGGYPTDFAPLCGPTMQPHCNTAVFYGCPTNGNCYSNEFMNCPDPSI
ncbi:hypothetical protein CWB99_00075 [Pseudoalteromonas rubra]|uniref:Uncharacterized protein n=1 Tax=Pseudoalteromonas rubra TaxID=43658 RepID=A0A5S3WUP1_9GAMM|nr:MULTISPECIES: hypothetical protein [Pseudoalteromonas]MCO7189492.1 hypothetical protein [Pseudoalteromonas sp. XMcav2-N]TMP31832.1 hypothetical protein CWC00_14560 [Pseudoalteromonas rubra]TMP33085.1 hypothetical protein CWB99_00075 [Pseudoalteromonas rubra]